MYYALFFDVVTHIVCVGEWKPVSRTLDPTCDGNVLHTLPRAYCLNECVDRNIGWFRILSRFGYMFTYKNVPGTFQIPFPAKEPNTCS